MQLFFSFRSFFSEQILLMGYTLYVLYINPYNVLYIYFVLYNE